jgi:biopolymer transport protein TolR
MNVGGSHRKSRKRRAPMSEINVVPYIDVTFVLLMIFMITAPLVQNGVDVELPQAEAATPELKEGVPPVIVSIKKDGSYYINLGDGENEPVDESELLERIKDVMEKNKDTQIFVGGDQAVEYGKIITVMAALKKNNVPKVGLMTTPPPEK